MSGKPFALIGVNSDGDREEAAASLKDKNVTWRSFWNGEDGVMGPISIKWSVYSVSYTHLTLPTICSV